MRCKLVTSEPKVGDVRMALLEGLGLSVELSFEAVERYLSQQVRQG